MTHDVIPVNKALVPYYFQILLANKLYEVEINYNETHGFFTIAISKDGKTICAAEKIVYGKPLFEELRSIEELPPQVIIPYDLSKECNAVTFDNLSETVYLVIDNQGISILEDGA